VLYRYKLNGTLDGFDTDSIPYFRTTNRYRDIALSTDGRKIYLVTDSIGTTSGPSGSGTSTLANPGGILEFSYAGPTLSLPGRPDPVNTVRNYNLKLYPNPASEWLRVEVGDDAFSRFTAYRITDLSGRIMLEGRSLQKQFMIDLRGLSGGMYICKLENSLGLEIASEKIIIRR
jgi:hypothetical protein